MLQRLRQLGRLRDGRLLVRRQILSLRLQVSRCRLGERLLLGDQLGLLLGHGLGDGLLLLDVLQLLSLRGLRQVVTLINRLLRDRLGLRLDNRLRHGLGGAEPLSLEQFGLALVGLRGCEVESAGGLVVAGLLLLGELLGGVVLLLLEADRLGLLAVESDDNQDDEQQNQDYCDADDQISRVHGFHSVSTGPIIHAERWVSPDGVEKCAAAHFLRPTRGSCVG